MAIVIVWNPHNPTETPPLLPVAEQLTLVMS
jgi:hypothetical protein